ncbi:MAG: TldD/PmbA family protein [Betaproteobacteria bacterium]|nr:TldD/PmbA family protein [Betaproteobacteria bacterium]
MEQLLKKVLSQLSIGSNQWVGLRYHREHARTREVRDAHPESNRGSESAGVMIEWLVDGQFGYAATPDLCEASLLRTAALAHGNAVSAARRALYRFDTSRRPPSQGIYSSKVSSPLAGLSDAEQFEVLVSLTKRMRTSEAVITATAWLQNVQVESCFVSSNGAHFEQDLSLVSVALEAVGQRNGVVQKRSNHGLSAYSYQGGAEFVLEKILAQQADKVAVQLHELLEAAECPNETTHLVLAPDQMMLQIHESIGHPLELDRILGDERNYAGSSFVKLEDFGRLQYGSELLNVTFDPGVEHEFASYAFDDCGHPAHREFLIEKGVLKRGLGSLESQARSGVLGVANQRASSWNRAPIDRMANINVEPGEKSFEQIISGIERGVFMESNKSWSIDDYRNKFQFGCEYARVIENGKLGRVLRNPNYRGVTSDFWKKLVAVGDPSTLGVFGTPYCGKGEPNQSIRVGHASPVCAFAGVEVFGGAQ